MIIFDYNNLENIIRINGIERGRFKRSDIAGNIVQIERKAKERIDGITVPLGYHFFLHIFTKGPPPEYIMHIRPTTSDPPLIWWEPT